MTFTLKLDNVGLEWGSKRIFENVSFEVETFEKVVLFGRNGVGKSSLIAALMDKVPVTEGTIARFVPIAEWGWLEQDLQVGHDVPLRKFVQSGNPLVLNKWEALRRAEESLGSLDATAAASQTEALLERYNKAYEDYARAGGYEFETEVDSALTRLGLPKSLWETAYHDLSGGQKTRAQLARLMVKHPTVLLLDEPTNHLDAETLLWLESWIQSYEGTVIMVTHDRTFIDHVANAVIELTPQGCRRYKGGYSAFRQTRDLEIKSQQALYDKQEREREKLLEAIQRYKEWYQQAHRDAGERNPFLKKRAMKNATRFRAKEQALERLESRRVERPKEGFHANITFDDHQFEARVLAEMKGARVQFGDFVVLDDVNLTVERGNRIAIIGPNGSGKSTLLRVMMGTLQSIKGDVRHHPELKIGYFDQELSRLNLEETVLDSVLRLPGMTQSWARTILAGFLFRSDDVFQKIGNLSMGERCRVAFVQLYFSEANLLVLDEPTNYLDVDTRERVEEALLRYPGALLVVSHDRYMLAKVANRVARIQDGHVRVFQGTVEEWERSQESPKYANKEVENRIATLELSIAQWMAEDEPQEAAARSRLVERIRAAKLELQQLKLQ